MKILNLYAGIGGNRKLWGDDYEITAVEYDAEIARAYQDRYPNDTVIVGDAKQYLLDHYKEFDFIWASPPCQSHSVVRKCRVDTNPETNTRGVLDAVYPDMSLWEIIIFLQNHGDAKFVVENVIPYYEPLIKPTAEIDRHIYWSNFRIHPIDVVKDTIIEKTKISDLIDFDLSPYKMKRKQQVIRNQVNHKVGEHILNCAFKLDPQPQGLFALSEVM